MIWPFNIAKKRREEQRLIERDRKIEMAHSVWLNVLLELEQARAQKKDTKEILCRLIIAGKAFIEARS